MPPEVIIPLAEDVLTESADAAPDPRPIWEIIAELGESIPEEDRARVPHDGAKNYKHYLYGSPKVE